MNIEEIREVDRTIYRDNKKIEELKEYINRIIRKIEIPTFRA